MASDWIKIEDTLPDKPEVVQMAAILDIDQDAVSGKLLRVWIWADHNSVDGNEIPVTSAFLDRLVCRPGFAAAMRAVGWLGGRDSALSFPRFDRHNGQSAKARAETNRRVAAHRESSRSSPECNAKSVTSALQKPLPEKRREEKSKNIPQTPAARRIAALFQRRLTTAWSDREVKAFKACGAIEDTDLDALERYYAAERSKGEKGLHRRDLLTFLNNFRGELDRAHAKHARPVYKTADKDAAIRAEVARQRVEFDAWMVETRNWTRDPAETPVEVLREFLASRRAAA